MRHILAVMVLALMVSGSAFGQASATPTLAGTYVQSPSGYTKMELSTSSGFKTSGGMKSAFSYGIAHVHGKWIYAGSDATARLGNRPVFVLVPIAQMDVSTQTVALVRLDAKKDHREAEYCEAGAWSGVQVEDKNRVPLTVTRIPNTNNLTITPAADLPPGEYLLITDVAKGYDGYDFVVK